MQRTSVVNGPPLRCPICELIVTTDSCELDIDSGRPNSKLPGSQQGHFDFISVFSPPVSYLLFDQRSRYHIIQFPIFAHSVDFLCVLSWVTFRQWEVTTNCRIKRYKKRMQ